MGRIVSVNTGKARLLSDGERTVRTAIVKQPVDGRRRVGPEGVDGDEQANRTVHGAPRKAVYVYPSEHYPFWRELLDRPTLTWGMFGENLTTEGLAEAEVRPGDRLEVGGALLRATVPRFPCVKLGIRFEDPGFVEQFRGAGRPGFYCSVERAGELEAGATIRLEHVRHSGPTMLDLFLGTHDGASPR